MKTHTYFLIGAVVISILFSPFAFAQKSESETPESIQARVGQLINSLGDPNCMIRDDAQAQLISLGSEALPYLKEALNSPDLEIHQRAAYIIQALPQNWNSASDPPELRAFLTHYVSYDSLSKMLLLDEMNRLPVALRVQALERIFQNEKDVNNAFIAAMCFWYYRPDNNPEFVTLVQNMLKSYEQANYLPAQNLFYLINYAAQRSEATFWFDNQFENLTPLDRVPQNTVGALQKYIAVILAEQARREAERALSPDQIPNGKKLEFKPIKWENLMAGDDSVPPIAVIPKARLRVLNPRRYIITYIASTNSRSESDSDLSMSLFSSIPLVGPQCLLQRNMVTEAKDWIFWEASCSLQNLNFAVNSDKILYQILAESLNDYSYPDLAVELFSKANPKSLEPENKARIYYFKALQAKKEGNTKLQWECVQNALKEDKTETDSLIMQWEMCQIPQSKLDFNDITDEIREKQEQNIIKMLDSLEKSINRYNIQYFTDTNYCNQYAWLAVKTRHNLDKALKYAVMAVESNSNSAACLDTLAHVFAAQGNFVKAIEIQKQAVEKDPASRSLYNNLQNFIEQKQAATAAREKAESR